ncbi:MAG: DUF4340 domain-containing protein [Deltaproteobacteria bacterium]|nr:MAG: DUF4340 domain-containing protein [Deltaproteobacteria bacterium]
MSKKVNQSFGVVVLLFVAAFLGILVYNDHKETQKQKKQEESDKLVFQLDQKLDPTKEKQRKKLIQEVSAIEMFNGSQPKGKQTLRIERDKRNHWLIVQPVKTPADKTEVGYVLRDLLQVKGDKDTSISWKKGEKAPTKKLKEFGLETPKYKLTFTFRKTNYSVWLGIKNSFSQKHYAWIKGQRKIVLADTSLFTVMSKKLFDLRNKNIFTRNTKAIKALTITRKNDVLVLAREKVKLFAPIVKLGKAHKHDHGHGHKGHDHKDHKGHDHKGHDHKGHGHAHHGHSHAPKRLVHTETRWTMLQPVRAAASESQVNGLLSSLKYLRATKFVSEDAKKDAKKFGLDKPRVIIEVTMRNKKKMVLNISSKKVKGKEVLYAASGAGGPIGVISKYIMTDLEKDAEKYRNRKVVQFKMQHAFSLRFGKGDKLFSVVKLVGKNKGWRIFDPSPRRAKKEKVENLLNQLLALKAVNFVKENASAADLKTFGLDKPSRTYHVYGRNTRRLVSSVLVGKKAKNGNFYVTNHEKKQVMEVKAKDVGKLFTESWQVLPKGKPPKRKAPQRRAAPKERKAPASRPAAPRKVVGPRVPAPAPRKAAPAPAPRKAAPAPRKAAPVSQPAKRK